MEGIGWTATCSKRAISVKILPNVKFLDALLETYMLQPKPIALAVALAALAFSGQAAALTVSEETMLGAIFVGGVEAVTETATAPDTTTVQGDAYTGGRFGQNTFFNGDLATGTTNVRVLAGAAEAGVATSSSIVYSALVRNDTATDIAGLTFSFFIGRGRVAVQSEYESTAYSGYAGLVGEIYWGDTKLWGVNLGVSSIGTVDGDGNLQRVHGQDFTTDGAAGDFTVAGSDAEYYYDPYAKTLDLGILAAGDERLLTYTLGGVGEYVGGGGGDMYGYGGQAIVGAFDPFDFEGRPVDEFGNPLPGGLQAPIPEPGTYAMLGLGLAMLSGLARYRRRRGDR